MSEQDPQDPTAVPASWTLGAPHAPSASVQSTINQMTEQMRTVIEAAERAAEAIRYDAEEQARRHLAEAQRKADRLTAERVGLISELTDDLIRHAANVRDHSEQMVRALEDAINSVTDKLEQPAMTDSFSTIEPTGPPLPFAVQPEAQAAPPPPPAAAPMPPEGQMASGSYTDLIGMPPPPAVQPEAQAAPPPPPAAAPMPPEGQMASGSYTDLIGMPPPPPPASAPAPPPAPPSAAAAAVPAPSAARLQPNEETADSAAAGINLPVEMSQEALLYATRLAIAGENRESIGNALRLEYGVTDPKPIVDRVLADHRP